MCDDDRLNEIGDTDGQAESCGECGYEEAVMLWCPSCEKRYCTDCIDDHCCFDDRRIP